RADDDRDGDDPRDPPRAFVGPLEVDPAVERVDHLADPCDRVADGAEKPVGPAEHGIDAKCHEHDDRPSHRRTPTRNRTIPVIPAARSAAPAWGPIRPGTNSSARADPVWPTANPAAPRSRASSAVGSPSGPRSARVRLAERLAISARASGRPFDAARPHALIRSPMSGKLASPGSVRRAGPRKPPMTSILGKAGNLLRTRPSREAQSRSSGRENIRGSLAPSAAMQALASASGAEAIPASRASATSAAVDAPAPPPAGIAALSLTWPDNLRSSRARNRRARSGVMSRWPLPWIERPGPGACQAATARAGQGSVTSATGPSGPIRPCRNSPKWPATRTEGMLTPASS